MQLIVEQGKIEIDYAGTGGGPHRRPEFWRDVIIWWAGRERLISGIAHHMRAHPAWIEGRYRHLQLVTQKKRAPLNHYADRIERGDARICGGRMILKMGPTRAVENSVQGVKNPGVEREAQS